MSAKQEKRNQLRSQLASIGELFILDRLILVAADIPVWSITSGRSNYLASCLRRFNNTFLFVNDADMVLRLASTIANYIAMLVLMLLSPLGIGNIDSHGGYFRGRYCLDLLYELALREVPNDSVRYHKLQDELKKHSISWITIPSDNSAPL